MVDKVTINGVIEDDGIETVTVEVVSSCPLDAAKAYVDAIDHIIAQRKKKTKEQEEN